MAVDMFLKLAGIEGESGDSKHKNEIEILSFSWGTSQQGEIASGGRGGGPKANVQDFSFVHKLDKASPMLFFHACTGTHIKEAVLSVRKAGENPQDYLTIKLSDILISSFRAGGNSPSGDFPLEQVSLNFSKIELAYKPQDANGQLGSSISWSCGGSTEPPPAFLTEEQK